MRIYRRIGKNTGVSMGLGTYLVGWILLVLLVVGFIGSLGH